MNYYIKICLKNGSKTIFEDNVETKLHNRTSLYIGYELYDLEIYSKSNILDFLLREKVFTNFKIILIRKDLFPSEFSIVRILDDERTIRLKKSVIKS